MLKLNIKHNNPKKQKKSVHFKQNKVKSGKVKKQKESKSFNKTKVNSLATTPKRCKTLDGDNNTVARYVATIPMKNPMDKMIKSTFETMQHSQNSVSNFFDKISVKNKKSFGSIHCIDYKVPVPEKDFEVDISELGSSDLGSIVESEDPEEEPVVFVKQKVGEYQFYEVPTGAIILLYGKSKIFLHGLMRVSVLFGCVDILGKHLDSTSPPTMVYSPRGSAYLSIVNMNIDEKTDENKRKHIKKQIINLGLHPGVSNDVAIYKLKSTTVVLHCENVIDKATEFLEENLAQKIYPKFLNGLRCIFKNVTSQDWNMLEINPEWNQLIALIKSKQNKNFGNDTKLLLSGGKSVGKSTLLRYLVNQLLNTRKEVVVLDLDPGQPEFTVPGAISIVKVTSALLGPNYTHLQETEKTIFVPNINISVDHESYIECVKELLKFLPQNVPIIVNYMGFTKGIGLYLTARVLGLLQADVVVQIDSQNESRNFRVDLTPEAVKQQLIDNAIGQVNVKEYKLVKIDSVAKGIDENVGWELEPRQVREMCILSYMSGILPMKCKYLTEKNVPIYQTPLDEVTILCNGKRCEPSAANANIVALCTNDPKVCVGWGIVRGICMDSNVLLLLTPLRPESLDKVRHIVVGSVTLPPTIYLGHHDAIRGLVPYTFKGELSNFARTPKRNIMYKQNVK